MTSIMPKRPPSAETCGAMTMVIPLVVSFALGFKVNTIVLFVMSQNRIGRRQKQSRPKFCLVLLQVVDTISCSVLLILRRGRPVARNTKPVVQNAH